MSDDPTVSIIATRPNPDHRDWQVVTVDCPYCSDTHYHGVPTGGPDAVTHRVADCGTGSYWVRR